MQPGITAPLSPNEEVTLRRIGLAVAARNSLRSSDVTRLIALQLVEEVEGRLILTDMGRQRYQALARAPSMAGVADIPEFLAVSKEGLQDP